MLGMMNSPNDGVDFYSEPESGMPIFDKKVDKPKVSYMKDGRKLLNGELELTHSPEIMWNSLITRSVAQKIHSSNISCINEPTEGQDYCCTENSTSMMMNEKRLEKEDGDAQQASISLPESMQHSDRDPVI
uniref:Secreted protein n=1 Tax=Parascaris univalens TaxID=6257 RepID=A0A915C0Y4_PARUN